MFKFTNFVRVETLLIGDAGGARAGRLCFERRVSLDVAVLKSFSFRCHLMPESLVVK